jgi:hypothetical protein
MVVVVAAWSALALRRDADGRILAASWIGVPVVVCQLASHLLAPLWHLRALAFLSPFLCLVVARAVWTRRDGSPRAGDSIHLPAAAASTLLILVVGCLAIARDLDRGMIPGFREAVGEHHRRSLPGDAVVIPNPRVFWSWGWYAAGPRSVDPLDDSQILVGEAGETIAQSVEDLGSAPGRLWVVRRTPKETVPGVRLGPSERFGEVELIEAEIPPNRSSPPPAPPP